MTMMNEAQDIDWPLVAGSDLGKLRQLVSEAPVRDVLKLWNHIEPDRFPLRFGGLGWNITWETFQDISFKEFGAAIDAAAGHGWSLELSTHGRSPRDESPTYAASVAFQSDRSVVITSPDPIEALLRAVVLATALSDDHSPAHQEDRLGVSFTGLPLTQSTMPRWAGAKTAHRVPRYMGEVL